ncbi:MAG: winged helix-turn-helix transcriptional regulator [Actinobacteria bacterium]|nr:winged helix-turn-helix transcriptional regulator [Actinomycetota bacterium]
MVEVLRNKNLATRFQILIDIAYNGPNVPQRDIAKRVNVSPQAVSDYVSQLVKEGLLISHGRSKHQLTNEGVNWMIKILRELRDYVAFVERTVTNIAVCTAIADDDLIKGQEVRLEMRDGLLFATSRVGDGAKGIAFSDAIKGEDVGVTNIEGIVELSRGKITILNIPTVAKGGSKRVDLTYLKKAIQDHKQIGVIGIEALVTLKCLGVEPRYSYGVIEASVEAAQCGLSFLIACTDDAIHSLLSRLDDEGIDYELVNLELDNQ